MAKSIFGEGWFAWRAFDGLRKAMHGKPGEAEAQERGFIEQLSLALLDRQRNGRQEYSDALDFFAFCQQRLSESRSQILQDLWVLHMLGEKRGGYFVEFGACDGKMLSNTLLLERNYGWRGILAEPNPAWHEGLRRNRACGISEKCVYARTGEKLEFAGVSAMPELSRIMDIAPDDVHERNGNRAAAEVFQVETVSLLDLLREFNAPEVIDYLSIDTEGSEYEILAAFDFDAFRFRTITVEHAGEKRKRDMIHELLEARGYRRWHKDLSRWDDWYVHEDVPGGSHRPDGVSEPAHTPED